MTDWQSEAALDNARWCDLMCRAHGLPGTFTALAWTNPSRTPMYYPDAVTLSPEATAADLLPHIDAGPGASVKDSFATLDLPGFEVLFEAQWIHRDAPARSATSWQVVQDEAGLAAWERACGTRGLFRPALLAEARLVHAPDLSAGAVLTASGPAVGVSNVFGAWDGVVATAAELFPGRPLVGYESDPAPALRHGFTTVGPLRVWLRA
ncbi:hypothetical protein [Nonomuraea gerenzanensis]|uniref:Uncharacterized protein n=1 Tax=Nonomuraea gerenzanensis TaxID=93944 RepID=A0A1M4DYT4_9ACTN|nr:hypothetical protein [Nonomuraea gerenzanensis]UBU14045.1 hypothetical protein LCN96_03160 [Nonomuraea gerenzanensis]SBO91735.1 hypothetical protein BN4615_P1249 [Nonomuraea gerenzanensis]